MSTACAETVEFKLMGLNGEPVTRSHLFLKPFNVAVLKLDDLAA